MAKERETIRISYVKDLRELLRRVFYRSPSRFLDPALALIEHIVREGGCISLDFNSLARILCRRRSDIEYIVRKLLQVKMLRRSGEMLCLSDEFCRILESMIQVWKSILEYAEESRAKRILGEETAR
ncbi:MAG: hypothetical protein GXO23_01655 [Crenarchaeota archaeon]|nr:hypothetical protein [Thermoproteota archaeon]